MTFGHFLNEAQTNELLSNGQHSPNQQVTVSQVITDQPLIEKSQHLEATIQSGQLVEYCNYKVENAANENQANVWKFIMATFSQNKSKAFVDLLGFDDENVEAKIERVLSKEEKTEHASTEPLNSQLNESLNLYDSSSSAFDHIDLNQKSSDVDEFAQIARSFSPIDLKFESEIEATISDSLLLGRYKTVVDLCIQENRFTDAILVASFFDKDLFAQVQKLYLDKNKNKFTKVNH